MPRTTVNRLTLGGLAVSSSYANQAHVSVCWFSAPCGPHDRLSGLMQGLRSLQFSVSMSETLPYCVLGRCLQSYGWTSASVSFVKECTCLMLCLSFSCGDTSTPTIRFSWRPSEKVSLDPTPGRFADFLFAPKHAKSIAFLTTTMGPLHPPSATDAVWDWVEFHM